MVEEGLSGRPDRVRKPLHIDRREQRPNRAIPYTRPLRSGLVPGVAPRDQFESWRPLGVGSSRKILPRHERVRFRNERLERNTRSVLTRDENAAARGSTD
jgi:hypothetical protein